MALATNNVLVSFRTAHQALKVEKAEQHIQSTVENMQRIVNECKTGQFCRPLASPQIRFNELKESLIEFTNCLRNLLRTSNPIVEIGRRLLKFYINQSYKNLRDLVNFASIHFSNVQHIANDVVDAINSLKKVLLNLAKIAGEMKEFINERVTAIMNILKEFVYSNKKALGTTVLSTIPLSCAGSIVTRGILGTTSLVGQRAFMLTSTVASVTIPVVTVGTMIYKEYKRRKMLKEIANEITINDNCYGARDTRAKLILTANELQEKAKEFENENNTELALVYVQGSIRIREMEDTVCDVDCKCFSESS